MKCIGRAALEIRNRREGRSELGSIKSENLGMENTGVMLVRCEEHKEVVIWRLRNGTERGVTG